jgi:CheY-like chemotaxis protein
MAASYLGYRVIEAENGEAALRILGQSQLNVDLLFTDIVMPGQLDGRTLAHRAQELRPTHQGVADVRISRRGYGSGRQ